MPSATRPAALLLTGGASRRMGRDKATLTVGGRSWAQRTAGLLIGVADPVIEVGPGFSGLPHVSEVPAGQGPLAAIAAGWAVVAPAAAVLVIATDLPRLTDGLLRLLASHPGSGCIVPVDEAGRAQPLCARYPGDAMARADGLVRSGRRAARELLDGQAVTWLAPSEWSAAAGRSDALADVDTPGQLAAMGRSES